jgi:hypothetical protein
MATGCENTINLAGARQRSLQEETKCPTASSRNVPALLRTIRFHLPGVPSARSWGDLQHFGNSGRAMGRASPRKRLRFGFCWRVDAQRCQGEVRVVGRQQRLDDIERAIVRPDWTKTRAA